MLLTRSRPRRRSRAQDQTSRWWKRNRARAEDLAGRISEDVVPEVAERLEHLRHDAAPFVESVVERIPRRRRSRRQTALRLLVGIIFALGVAAIAYLIWRRRDMEPAYLVGDPDEPLATPGDPGSDRWPGSPTGPSSEQPADGARGDAHAVGRTTPDPAPAPAGILNALSEERDVVEDGQVHVEAEAVSGGGAHVIERETLAAPVASASDETSPVAAADSQRFPGDRSDGYIEALEQDLLETEADIPPAAHATLSEPAADSTSSEDYLDALVAALPEPDAEIEPTFTPSVFVESYAETEDEEEADEDEALTLQEDADPLPAGGAPAPFAEMDAPHERTESELDERHEVIVAEQAVPDVRERDPGVPIALGPATAPEPPASAPEEDMPAADVEEEILQPPSPAPVASSWTPFAERRDERSDDARADDAVAQPAPRQEPERAPASAGGTRSPWSPLNRLRNREVSARPSSPRDPGRQESGPPESGRPRGLPSLAPRVPPSPPTARRDQVPKVTTRPNLPR